MDSFTQSMIQRTKQRQAMLSKSKTGTIPNEKVKDEKKQSEKITNSVDLNQKENLNILAGKSDSPKRSKEISLYSGLTKNSSPSLNRGQKLTSPEKMWKTQNPRCTLPTPEKITKNQLPKQVFEKTPSKTSLDSNVKSGSSELVLDKPLLKSLQTQGFTPSGSRSRLIYEFAKEQLEKSDESSNLPLNCSGNRSIEASNPQQRNLLKETNQPRNMSSSCLAMLSNQPLRTSHLSTPKKSSNNVHKQFSPSLATSKTPMTSRQFSPTTTTSKISDRSKVPSPVSSPSALSTKTLNPTKCSSSNNQFSRSCTVVKTPDRSKNAISGRIAQFELSSPLKKDPCEMTLSERKAFFESSAQNRTPSKPLMTPKMKTLENNLSNQVSKERPSQTNLLGTNFSSGTKELVVQDVETDFSARRPEVLTPNVKSTTFSSPIQTNVEKAQFSSPVQLNIDSIKVLSPIKTGSISEESPKAVMVSAVNVKPSIAISAVNEDILKIRPIRVSPPKPGKLYPSLSDIDASTESESECLDDKNQTLVEDKDTKDFLFAAEDLDSSFAVDILGKAGLIDFVNTPKRKYPTASLMQEQHYDHSPLADAKSDKDDCSSSLESYKKTDGLSACKYSKKETEVTPLSDDEPRLYHSVSFYRKQQQDLIATPKRGTVSAGQQSENENKRATQPKMESGTVSVELMMKNLQEEVKAQETVMAQASQALNFCRSTAEFSGSTEQVEGEKLLLIATQKRNAAVSEISRLKSQVENCHIDQPISLGTLSISDVKLPLKKEFMSLISKGGDDFVHYFILMIRNQGQVIPFQMLSTIDGVTDGALRFPNLIKLRDLPPTFQLVVEIYALQTRKEKLDHEAKYHIKKETNKLRLTPRKSESRLHSRVPKTNPHQTSSLRNSSFGLVGFCQISQPMLRHNIFTLDKVPLASPISGQLQMKIQCQADVFVEERGFLTVFEDVGGYGAWHRRWCLLSNDQVLFWKYPDEEKRKTPMAHINLRKCVTEKVDIVSHDVCARPHTFLLVTARAPKDGDKDSLVMTTEARQTLTRHLLSADTKEERIRWCSLLNQILFNLRTWDVDSTN